MLASFPPPLSADDKCALIAFRVFIRRARCDNYSSSADAGILMGCRFSAESQDGI
jgi:hypothetical protein